MQLRTFKTLHIRSQPIFFFLLPPTILIKKHDIDVLGSRAYVHDHICGVYGVYRCHSVHHWARESR
jgi:hypothetical protein